MGLGVQPQRVPLGVLTIGGKEYPVFVTPEWYRALQTLATAAGTSGGTSGSSGGVPAGGVDATSVDSEDAIDSGYGQAQLARVLAIALEQGLQALEVDSELPRLRAQLATLAARIDCLEQSA